MNHQFKDFKLNYRLILGKLRNGILKTRLIKKYQGIVICITSKAISLNKDQKKKTNKKLSIMLEGLFVFVVNKKEKNS